MQSSTPMTHRVPDEIKAQVSQVLALIGKHLASHWIAVHLYGSALQGGLRRYSDLDLLVTVTEPLDDAVRQSLMVGFLRVSAPPGESLVLRPLEVTILLRKEVVPWRYPAKRELQFGEWLRKDIEAGVLAPATEDIDLTILLRQVLEQSVPLVGVEAGDLFDSVPQSDFIQALLQTMQQWNSPSDWTGDERNILLTLARIWYSVVTGKLTSKDAAANWALLRLPQAYHPVLQEARDAYLGLAEDTLSEKSDQVAAFIAFIRTTVYRTVADEKETTDGRR